MYITDIDSFDLYYSIHELLSFGQLTPYAKMPRSPLCINK